MREGYVLTEDAEADRSAFEREYGRTGSCSCFTGAAPCASCTHPGNPINQDENDSCWVKENSLQVGAKVIILRELPLNLGSLKYRKAPYLPSSLPAGTLGEISSVDGEGLVAVDFGSCTVWARLENLLSVRDTVEKSGTQKVEMSIQTPVGWVLGGSPRTNPEGAPCPNFESFWIIPDQSIPWEQDRYRAILPKEVVIGDEWYRHGKWEKLAVSETMWLEGFPWWRLKTYRISEVKEMQKTGDVQKKLDLQWEAAKALEQERNELQKKVEELSEKVSLLTDTNASLCRKIESLEASFTEAGTLSIGKAGISVSLGDRVMLAHKATYTLYTRESAR